MRCMTSATLTPTPRACIYPRWRDEGHFVHRRTGSLPVQLLKDVSLGQLRHFHRIAVVVMGRVDQFFGLNQLNNETVVVQATALREVLRPYV